MHSHAFLCTHLGQEHPAQLGKLRGVLGRAAHLRRQLVDGLRRDGAVLVAHIGVLLLLEGVHGLDLVHGLAARDDDRVEFTEIHKNAHKCITGRMQHIQNAPS